MTDCYIIYDPESDVGQYLATNIRELGTARVWHHHRDYRPGENIFDRHFDLLAKSGKALSVMTPNDSSWADYLHMSAEKRMSEQGKPYSKIAWCGKCEGLINRIADFVDSREDKK